MSIPAIQSVLQQLRATALQTGITAHIAKDAPADAPAGGFAAELQRSLNGISDTQQRAWAQADAFELGAPGVSLNDVMIDIQKSNVALQTGVQVRNRLVAAYQDIMNMPA